VQTCALPICGPESRLVNLFKADSFVQAGRVQDAIEILESIRGEDDPRWVRTYANAQLRNGNERRALELFLLLASKAPSPDVFRAIADLAGKQKLHDVEITGLLRLLALEPSDVSARTRLARLFTNQEEFSKAI